METLAEMEKTREESKGPLLYVLNLKSLFSILLSHRQWVEESEVQGRGG